MVKVEKGLIIGLVRRTDEREIKVFGRKSFWQNVFEVIDGIDPSADQNFPVLVHLKWACGVKFGQNRVGARSNSPA